MMRSVALSRGGASDRDAMEIKPFLLRSRIFFAPNSQGDLLDVNISCSQIGTWKSVSNLEVLSEKLPRLR